MKITEDRGEISRRGFASKRGGWYSEVGALRGDGRLIRCGLRVGRNLTHLRRSFSFLIRSRRLRAGLSSVAPLVPGVEEIGLLEREGISGTDN
jgi:hypothetical protein